MVDYYKVGGSLRYNHPTYIERLADQELYEELKKGELCYVLNSRQMGKSSLRVRTMKKLQKEDFKCASIDIGRLGKAKNLEQLYRGFIHELWRHFNISTKFIDAENWWNEHKSISPILRLSCFFEDILLLRISQKIIIFIDEIDSIIDLKFENDLFQFIRSCYNNRVDNFQYERLTFCLLGVVSASDLIKNTQQQSFNIGKEIELAGFDLNTAKKSLLPGLQETVDYPEEILEEIFKWTGGQPFLTQKLCQLVLFKSESRNPSIENIIKKYVIENWEFQDQPEHLKTIRNRLLHNKKQVLQMLSISQVILEKGGITLPNSEEIFKLKLTGLITSKHNKLFYFNRIYEEIFNIYWIEQQLNLLENSNHDIKERIFIYFLSISDGYLDSNRDKAQENLSLERTSIITAILLLIINALSLKFSYDWFSSEPWKEAFDYQNKGAIIEFTRSLILIFFSTYLLGFIFKQETHKIIKDREFWWFRRLLIVFAFMFFVFITYNQLYKNPSALYEACACENKYSEWSTRIKDFHAPYLFYLPYSYISFIFISLPVTFIHIFSSLKDIFINSKYANRIQGIIFSYQKQNNYENQASFLLIQENFFYFHDKFNYFLSRYSTLFLGLFISAFFELVIGRNTLSEIAKSITILNYLFGFIAVLVVMFWGIADYQVIFREMLSILLSERSVELNIFKRKYSLIKICIKIILTRTNLYLILFWGSIIILLYLY